MVRTHSILCVLFQPNLERQVTVFTLSHISGINWHIYKSHNTHFFMESQTPARSTTIKRISQSARRDWASKWCLALDPSLHGCGSPWRLTGPIHSGSLGRVAPLFFSQLFPIEMAFSSPTESIVELLVPRPLATHRTKCIWTLPCKSKTYSIPKTLLLMTRCSCI